MVALRGRIKEGFREILPKEFYARRTEDVAMDLLGKVLVRMINGRIVSGVIVETEAYFGDADPASRAKRKGDLRATLYGDAGNALVYGIHKQWMLNAVAHTPGGGGAVLIRALEPLEGINTMMLLRRKHDLRALTTGPGRLTQALAIDKRFHKKPLYVKDYGLWIEDRGIKINKHEIIRDFRIGVTEDLPEPYRYLVAESPFISVKPRNPRLLEG